MTGACRRAAAVAVAAVLCVALVATAPAGTAAAATPLAVEASPVNELAAADADGASTIRIPCDYASTNTVTVEAPCTGTCGLDRQYRVKQRVDMWTPGTPKTEEPLFYYIVEYLCTPTRALAEDARSGRAGRHALTCLDMFAPDFKKLCVHAPATAGCGWKTAPSLTWAAAAAIKAAVPKPPKQFIAQCRRSQPVHATI